jgi:hypothetical protein
MSLCGPQDDDQGTYLAARRRGRKRKRRQARIGMPDAALTVSAGMAGRYAIRAPCASMIMGRDDHS